MALSAPTILVRTLPLTICFLLETWSPGAGLEARRPTGQIGEPQAKRTTSPPSKTHGRWFLNPITKSPPASACSGVGLTSSRERPEEVSRRLEVGSAPGGGSR